MTPSHALTASSSPAQHIDRQTIEQLAALARLRLTPAETEALKEHLHRMLSYVEKLRQVNTEGIEPLAHAVDVAAPRRADEVTNQPNTEALLQNALVRSGNFFVVPRIIE